MLDVKQLSGVMDNAVTVAVIANCAIQKMVAENSVEGFSLRGIRAWRKRNYIHIIDREGSAGSCQSAIYLNHAGVASLDWPQLRVITDLGNFNAATID
jgi:hypothetical protein